MTRQDLVGRLANIGWLALPVITVIAFIAVEAHRVAPAITISNLDYLASVERALVLSFTSLNRWVTGEIHPAGYPWLIRLGLALGWDAARVGQILSISGGVLGLAGTYLLALSVFRDRRFAGLALAFVMTTNLFLFYGSYEGTDMLAAGFQILCIGLLALSALGRTEPRARVVIASGLAAGLAYLVRYNGLVTMGAGMVWLIALALGRRRRGAWQMVGIYLLGFLLGSAFQWIPSLLATGNPFASDPGQNVWFHLYGKTDFITEWQQAPQGITTLQVIAAAPLRFIQHWWAAFEQFWIAPEFALLDAPLKLFTQAGLIFLLLAPGPVSLEQRGLVGLFALAQLASLAMLRLDRRFLIVLVPLLAIGAVYFLASLIPPRWEHSGSRVPFNILALLVGLAWAAQTPINFAQARPGPDQRVIGVSNALHAAGMRSYSEVASTHLKLQDASSLERHRFPQAYTIAPDIPSVDALTAAMRARGWRFIIYDRETGTKVYPALESLLSPELHPRGLAPIDFTDDRQIVVYRLTETLDECSFMQVRFQGGIQLECYEAHVSQDAPTGSGRRVGVYLIWRTESRFASSLKVFVHLLDGQGRVVAQSDSAPALWTWPTDTWEPGQTIVDFHQFPVGANIPPGSYTLQAGLYDEEAGARLNRVGAQDNPVDDKVILSTIQLK